MFLLDTVQTCETVQTAERIPHKKYFEIESLSSQVKFYIIPGENYPYNSECNS